MAQSCVSEFHPHEDEKSEKESFCLAELRQLVLRDEELRPINFFLEDAFLLHFCRFKKYDISETLKQIQKYCAVNCFKYPAQTERAIPSKCQLLGAGITRKLKNTDKDNRVVYLDSIGRWDYERGNFEEVLSCAFLQLEDTIRSVPSSATEGIVLIQDLSGVKISNLRIFTPARLRMIVDLHTLTSPIRVKGLHYVNMRRVCYPIFSLLKMLLPAKIRKRVFVHPSYESLHQEVLKSILPKSLGGLLEDDNAFDGTVEERILAREELYHSLAEVSISKAKV